MGTSTLRASSLRTVRRAMWATYFASDTAMVSPSWRLTCSMTCMSEVPSPTYTSWLVVISNWDRSSSSTATLPYPAGTRTMD